MAKGSRVNESQAPGSSSQLTASTSLLSQLHPHPHTVVFNAEAEGKSKCTAAHWCSKMLHNISAQYSCYA